MAFPEEPFARTSDPTGAPDWRLSVPPASSAEPNSLAKDLCEHPSDRNALPGELLTRLVTPEEAAQRLCISRAQVYVLLRTGSLESVRIGRSRRIPVVSLANFIQMLRKNAET